MILSELVNFSIGKDNWIENFSRSKLSENAVVFEDDSNTGYFYAWSIKLNKISDALHIYNVEDVIDKEKPCSIGFVWSDDEQVVALYINNYCHALFDFSNNAGYCRNGFPEANKSWTKDKNRVLTDELVMKYFDFRSDK